MAEFRLIPRSALGGLHEEIGATVLREIDGARLTTLSIPVDGESEMMAAVEAQLACTLPPVGSAAESVATGAHLLRLGADRLMLLQFPGPKFTEAPDLPGYPVDQSDAFVLLDLAGPGSIPALERSCRLDLDASVFGPGRIARTPIEGISVILWRRDDGRWLLLAPRSHAGSLVHGLCTSLRYTA